jgi:hypothetical protein
MVIVTSRAYNPCCNKKTATYPVRYNINTLAYSIRMDIDAATYPVR